MFTNLRAISHSLWLISARFSRSFGKKGPCEIVNTAFMLMAMYAGRPIISADDVAKDFFGLTTDKFLRKVSAGVIALPLVRMETSQKCAKGVHIHDLAAFLDERRAAAQKECQQLQGRGGYPSPPA